MDCNNITIITVLIITNVNDGGNRARCMGFFYTVCNFSHKAATALKISFFKKKCAFLNKENCR
jgi:hypothetical protein